MTAILQRKAWSSDLVPVLPDDGIIDEVAIEATILGRRVRLTMAERQAVTERMTSAGYSGREIADRLGCVPRSIVRRRARA